MHAPGDVDPPAGSAAVVYPPGAGLGLEQPPGPSACCSFSTASPSTTDVVSTAETVAEYVAVIVVTLAGSAEVADAGAVARTKIERASPAFSVSDDVPHTTGVSMAGSKAPLPLASMNAFEVQPCAARLSATQPAAKFTVSDALPVLVSTWP